MRITNNHKAFLELVRAGLWEQNVRLSQFGEIDFAEVCKLAEEQSVVGLVAAGLEHVADVKMPQMMALQLAGQTMQIEQRNKKMNRFLADLIAKMQDADIYALLVKGQGIAQCYVKPLWRASGDIDLFFSEKNYNLSVKFLSPNATILDKVETYKNHLPLLIDNWEVELHGTLRSGLFGSLDRTIDKVQDDVFLGGNVRSWMNQHTQVFIPRADEDVVFVFAHILQHFYKGGIGLRQVCDWCRLLWTYRDTINRELLEDRLHKMGVMAEWKAFASLAVDILGMPEKAMPLYSGNAKQKKKGLRICSFILKVGNFGQNENKNERVKPLLMRKCITVMDMFRNSLRHIGTFPYNSIKTCFYQILLGIKSQFNNP